MTGHRIRTARIAAAAAVIALAASACAGPRIPLEVGSKEIPVDIILGAQGRTPPPPPPAVDPDPAGFPGFIQPPIPRPDPGVPPRPGPPPPACPAAHPLDPALLVARLTAKPPVPAIYSYRNDGTITIGEAAPTAYPPATIREVRTIRPLEDDGFEYDVAATLGDEVTTTTYRVLVGGTTPDRGVYIVQIVTVGGGRTTAFTPTTPILLLPFPSPDYGTGAEDEVDTYRGQRYRSAATDPLTQTTMIVEATFAGKRRVDACGEWIDAFEVEVTLGSIVGPNRRLDFTGTYAIATQYGALVVEDTLTMTGTDAGSAVDIQNRSRINAVPAEPR